MTLFSCPSCTCECVVSMNDHDPNCECWSWGMHGTIAYNRRDNA